MALPASSMDCRTSPRYIRYASNYYKAADIDETCDTNYHYKPRAQKSRTFNVELVTTMWVRFENVSAQVIVFRLFYIHIIVTFIYTVK